MAHTKTAHDTSVQLFVDGAWRDPAEGRTVEAVSPATGETIGTVAQGQRRDAADAVKAARSAFDSWGSTTAFERAEVMHRIAAACSRRRDELAHALTLDQGKPLHSEAFAEVDELIGFWTMAAEDAVRLEGAIPASRQKGTLSLVMRRPLGPVAVITPWNWPYTVPAQVIAPALATGNTVVWVPAPSTSVCGALMMECIAEADLPPGVCNYVPGPGAEVGDEIAGHRDIAVVAFTGSTNTGRSVALRAAGKTQLLELGNNGPMVVMDDADVEAAVDGVLLGAFYGAGQSCAAAERVLVHEQIHDAFVEALLRGMGNEIRLGDPFDPRTTMGPLNNADVAEKMDSHVADALDRGAELLVGGQRDRSFPTELYWQATVLDNVSQDAVVSHEETFGPIAPLIPISSLDQAIEVTNALNYGLMAAIYTRDISKGLRYAEHVRHGNVNINESSNFWQNHTPFGGRAGSGSGLGRIGGRFAAEHLTEAQTVVISPPRG